MNTYEVWRMQNIECAPRSKIVVPPNELFKTNHTIKARTQKEAEYKLRRKFKNAGFHLMGLIVRKAEEHINRDIDHEESLDHEQTISDARNAGCP